MTEVVQHSELGASSCYRWWECPGSVRLSTEIKEMLLAKEVTPTTSSHARKGTAVHWMNEQRILGMIKQKDLTKDPGADQYLETTFTCEDGKEVEITRDMVDSSDVLVEEISEILYGIPKWWYNTWVEKRFHLPQIDAGCFGTADLIIFDPRDGTLYVIDFKNGSSFVSAEKNKQLLFYALGALTSLTRIRLEVETVITAIVQPNCVSRNVDAYRAYEYPVSDLDQFSKELFDAVQRTKKKNPEFKSGAHCTYCVAKQTNLCPTLNKDVSKAVSKDLAVLQSFAEKDIEISRENLISKLKLCGPKEISKKLDMVPILKLWIAAVSEAALEMAMSEKKEIPNYKLTKGRTTRKWKNAILLPNALSLKAGSREIRKYIFKEPEVMSPAQAEKLLVTLNICKKKKEASSFIEEFIECSEGKLTLKPDTYPGERIPVGTTAAEDFKNLIEGK